MELFLATLITGIGIGCIYGLMGLGLCAIFNASRVVNFGQGEFAMLGCYAASLFIFKGGYPIYIGILLVIALPVIFGIGLHYVLVEPLVRRNAPPLISILAVLGGSLIAEGVVGRITHYSFFPTRQIISQAFRYSALSIPGQYVLIILATVVLAIAYWLVLNRTAVGLAIQATGIDAEAASTLGVNLSMIRLLTWCVSAFIGAIAGFLVGPLMMPSALLGIPLLVNGFIAAVFGGFGEPFAALGGGVFLGLLANLFSTYISPGNSQLFMLLSMLLVLAVRPSGLLTRTR